MLRYSKQLLILAIMGSVAAGGCSSRGEDSLPGETVSKSRLQLAGTGISAEIAVYPGGSSFSSNVVVTNTGTAATTNWEVDIQLNNATVVGAPWNCTSTQTGTVLTLRSNSGNSVLAPGGTAWPGLNGVWNTTPYLNPTVIAVRRDVGMSGTGGASSGGAGSSAGKGGTSTGGKATGGSGTGGAAMGGTGTGGALTGGTTSGGAAGAAGAGNATSTSGGSGGSSGNNVAQNKTATASSSLSSNPASYGNDVSSTTSWCASTSALNEWWSVDLGADYALTGTEVTWPQSGRVYQYFVSISSDGTNYSEVVNQRGNTRTAQAQADSFTAQGRYLRLQVTGLATSPATSACIGDFKAFGTPVVGSGGGGATGTGSSSGGSTPLGDGGTTTGIGGTAASGSSTSLGGTTTSQGGATATGGSTGSGASGGSAANSEEFFIELPANLTPELVTLASYGDGGGLVINDGTKLAGASIGYVNASSLSTNSRTELGVGTELNDLYSAADVFVRGSHVHGNLTTAGAFVPSPQATSLIDGTTSEHASLAPIRRLSWRIGFTPGAAAVTVAEAEPKSISPGAFGDINLGLNSHLTLSQPGIYIVNGSLTMEPGSVLTVANSAYHVELYVRGNFIYRGTIQKAASSSNFVIGVAGSGDIPIERSFDAILVAPHASVQLGTVASGHRTSIYAKSILARANSTITQAAFNPNSLCAEGEARVGLCAHNCAADGDCVSGLACRGGVCGCTSDGSASCGLREPCVASADCQPGFVCGYGAVPRFGVAWDAVCMPEACANPGPESPDCGSTSALCGICPTCNSPDGCLPTWRAGAYTAWTEVGAIAGKFAVTDSGTASYSIPIPLPPGRVGLTPKLGIVYNSASREDLLGVGWQLSGFSYVARCLSPATPAGSLTSPKNRRGIRGDKDDQLCLDGQQLVPQASLDGGGGRGYTTANDSFKRIRAYGGEGANAEYIKVWTPEGRVLTYGEPSDNRGKDVSTNSNVFMKLAHSGQDAVTRVWALSKIEDQAGNYIEYTYMKVEGGSSNIASVNADAVCNLPSNGELPTECGTTEIWPETISYTGFPDKDHPPTRFVHFVYAQAMRPTAGKQVGYVGGVKTTRTQILNQIDILVGTAVVKSYVMDYTRTDGDVYEVKSIRECYDEAPLGPRCKSPTEFVYGTGYGLGPAVDTGIDFSPSPESLPDGQFIVWDANADGSDELITAQDVGNGGGQWVQLTHGYDTHGGAYLTKTALPFYQNQGAINHQDYGPLKEFWRQYVQGGVVDVDSDGMDDLLDVSGRWPDNAEALKAGAAPGTTVSTQTILPDYPALRFGSHTSDQWALLDVDGDGLADAVRSNSNLGVVDWRRNVGKGRFRPSENLVTWTANNLYPIDMDGDGAVDLVTQTKPTDNAATNAGAIVNWDGKPNLQFFTMGLGGPNSPDVLPIDVNGDGLRDILLRTPPPLKQGEPPGAGPGSVSLFINTGHGLNAPKSVMGKLEHDVFKSIRVLDYDADGRDDLILWDKKNQKWVGWRGQDEGLVAFELAAPLTTPGKFPLINGAVYASSFYWSAVADLDGDGARDLVVVKPPPNLAAGGPGRIFYHRGRTARTHILKQVTEGLGERTDILYDGELYAFNGDPQEIAEGAYAGLSPHRGTSNEQPTKVLTRLNRPAVRRARVSRHEGTRFALDHFTDYKNYDARTDYAGRGWVGFDKRTITQYNGSGEVTEATTVECGLNRNIEGPTPAGAGTEPWRYPYAGVPTKIETDYTQVAAERSVDGYRELRKTVVNDWRTAPNTALPGGLSSTGRSTFLCLQGRTTTETDLSVAHASPRTVSSIEETFDYDSSGNKTLHETWQFNGENRVQHSVENATYVGTAKAGVPALDQDRWLLRLPFDVTLERWRGSTVGPTTADFAGEKSSRSVHYDHNGLGQITKVKRVGSGAIPDLVTTLHPNTFGNVDRIERTAGAASVPRVTVVESFDADDIYPQKVTEQPDATSLDPLVKPHTAVFTHDARFGKLTSSTDSNGLRETWQHDGFGRLKEHKRPDGSGEALTYEASDLDVAGVFPVPAVLLVRTQMAGGGESTQETDSLGRTVRTTSFSIGSGAAPHVRVVQEMLYDSSGRLYQMTRPHVPSDATQGVVTNSYNGFNELTRVDQPDGTKIEYDRVEVASMTSEDVAELEPEPHDAFVVYQTDAAGAVETRVFDIDGQPTRSIAADGGRVAYTYDGFGNSRFTYGADNQVSEQRYDDVGRLVFETDKDRGDHDYTYTGFDEVDTHTRPGVNGGTARLTDTMHYDPFGRLDRLENSDGVRHWQFDQGNKAIGKLSAELVDSSTVAPNANSSAIEYDNQGRIKSVTQRIQGSEYAIGVEYTNAGRPKTIAYPGVGGNGFKVENLYDSESGQLREVRNADQPSVSFWKLEATYQGYLPGVESIGSAVKTTRAYHEKTGLPKQIKSDVAGTLIQDENYTYDDNRNLLSRQSSLHSNSLQVFDYDTLNRVTGVRNGFDSTTSTVLESIAYDSAGNIGSKSGVGTYEYSDLTGLRPHGVKKIGSRSFEYDDSGNQIERHAGPLGEQSLKYTLFGLPYEVSTSSASAAGVTKFEYGANGDRIAKQHFVLEDAANPTSARLLESFRIYVGGLYELRGLCPGGSDATCASPTKTHVYRVYGGGREVAQLHREEGAAQSMAAQHTYFLHDDQLGSIALITAGEDSSPGAPARGTVLKDQRYSPFGKATVTTSGAPAVCSGFTGLEEDSDEGLVNANGRLYDAEIGRFLSPDPFTPIPSWSQGLNPYTYALNNPLNVTDRSGFEPDMAGPPPEAQAPPPRWDGMGANGKDAIAGADPETRKARHRGGWSTDTREAGSSAKNAGRQPAVELGMTVTGNAIADPGQPGSANDGAQNTDPQPSEGASDSRDRAMQGLAAALQRGGGGNEQTSRSGDTDCPHNACAPRAYGNNIQALGQMRIEDTSETWKNMFLAVTVFAPVPELGLFAAAAAKGGVALSRAERLLKPLGSKIGTAGSSSRIRFVTGGMEAAEKLLSRLLGGGATRITPAGSAVEMFELAEGGTIGLRTVSSTAGVEATIDIAIEGIGISKIKFVP